MVLEQNMQDCYIKSIDFGLKLYALYLPAEAAKRIILSHDVAGGLALSFMAKYLHEHQCDVLFIEHRCGDSEGKYITLEQKEQWDAMGSRLYG